MEDNTQKAIDSYLALKDELKSKIIQDSILTRYKKLYLLETYGLMNISPYIQRPFDGTKYKEEFLKLCKQNPDDSGYVSTICDDVFNCSHLDRHQIVHLSYYFEEEDNPEEDSEYSMFPNNQIVILTNRGKNQTTYSISKEEFLDFLWEWIIKNNSIGWAFDW